MIESLYQNLTVAQYEAIRSQIAMDNIIVWSFIVIIAFLLGALLHYWTSRPENRSLRDIVWEKYKKRVMEEE
jgi:hypothetical protein